MAARSNASVCGSLFAGIAGSNPADGSDIVFLLNIVCCQIEVSAVGPSLVQKTPIEFCVSKISKTQE